MRYLTVAAASLALACGNPLDVGVVAVDMDGDVVVSPDEPGTFRITVTNAGDERVVWGRGSSSCQLTAEVLVGAVRHRIDFRSCTADVVEQGLDPGQRRTEEFEWGGQIREGGELVTLADGEYVIVGRAGDRAASGPVRIVVDAS